PVPDVDAGRPLEDELGADAAGPRDLAADDRNAAGLGRPSRHAQRAYGRERLAAAAGRDVTRHDVVHGRERGLRRGNSGRGRLRGSRGGPEEQGSEKWRAHRGTVRGRATGRGAIGCVTTGRDGQTAGPLPHAYHSGTPSVDSWASASA